MTLAPAAAVAAATTTIRPAESTPQEPIPQVAVGGYAGGNGGNGDGNDGWMPIGFDPSVATTLATLYGRWTSGLRELYANMVTACKAAAESHGADPHIRITLDGRRLILEDRDSMGMSWRVFKDGVAVAGRTGNDNPYRPGRWGIGSLAFVMLSDRMVIESHSRETGESFAVAAVEGGRFETGLEAPRYGWYGTRMSMVLRDGLDAADVIETTSAMAEMSGVRTRLKVRGAGKLPCPWNVVGGRQRAMIQGGMDAEGCNGRGYDVEIAAISPPERIEQYVGVASTATLADGDLVAVFHVQNADIDACCAFDSGRPGHTRKRDAWVAGMPIEGGSDGGRNRMAGCLKWAYATAIHCKNERRYGTTSDRERFTDEARKTIAGDIDALVDEAVSGMRFGTLGEYLADNAHRLIDGAARLGRYDIHGSKCATKKDLERMIAAIPRHERELISLSNAPIMVYGDPAGCGKYTLWTAVHCGTKARKAPKYSWLREAGVPTFSGRVDEPILVVADRFASRKTEAVMRHAAATAVAAGIRGIGGGNGSGDGNGGIGGRRIVLFRPAHGSEKTVDDYVAAGATRIDDYMKANGIPPISIEETRARKKARGTAPVYAYGGDWEPRSRKAYNSYSRHARFAPDDCGRNVVWTRDAGEFAALKSVLCTLPHDTYVAKERERPGRAVPFGEYAASAASSAYDTSRGRLSGKDIAAEGGVAVMVEYHGDAAGLAALMARDAAAAGGRGDDGEGDGDNDCLLVIGRADKLAALSAYLWSRGADFRIWLPSDLSWGGPEYVARVRHRGRLLARHEPEWLCHVSGLHCGARTMRTVAASLLHGYLAVKYGAPAPNDGPVQAKNPAAEAAGSTNTTARNIRAGKEVV